MFQLLSAMTNKLCLDNAPLPQDLTEGVDPEEWVSAVEMGIRGIWFGWIYLLFTALL